MSCEYAIFWTVSLSHWIFCRIITATQRIGTPCEPSQVGKLHNQNGVENTSRADYTWRMLETTPTTIPKPHSRHLVADALLMTVAAIWGATFFMIKDATQNFPVLGFLALRFLLITVIMLPLVIPLRRFPTRQEWKWGILAGFPLMLGYVMQTFAMRTIGSGRTGFITGMYVVIVPFLALILLRHRITRRVGIGTLLALVGLLILGYAPGGDTGDLLAIFCAVSYALQIIVVGQFSKALDWRFMTILQLGCVGVCSLILLPILAATRGCDLAPCLVLRPFADPYPTTISSNVIFAALFTGILASGVGFSVQIWAQKILSPSEAALIYAMESPFAALFGWLFLHEVLTLEALVGGALILTGVIITSVGSGHSKDEKPAVAPEAATFTTLIRTQVARISKKVSLAPRNSSNRRNMR
jgi:drug/metabolite transporter (DMT)-like permease